MRLSPIGYQNRNQNSIQNQPSFKAYGFRQPENFSKMGIPLLTSEVNIIAI